MSLTSKIPANLFTGFFGVGKSTTIKSMLLKKPDHERWAVLINEFGEVFVDQPVFEAKQRSKNVFIQEIPGGCMCCMMNVPMRTAINEILHLTNPDRLLIEPTGIGHPAAILDELRCFDLSGGLDVKAVICLVDPRHVHDPRIQTVKVFQDQVHLADVLVAGKADLASIDELTLYQEWARQLFPPKLHIIEACHGGLDLSLLDLDPCTTRAPLFPMAHNPNDSKFESLEKNIVTEPGKPYRAANHGIGYHGCGWIFSANDVFDIELLTDMLGPPGLWGLPRNAVVERLKGVFRLGEKWVFIDRTGNEVTVSDIAYRNDSRLEVIVPKEVKADWDKLETGLLKCLIP